MQEPKKKKLQYNKNRIKPSHIICGNLELLCEEFECLK